MSAASRLVAAVGQNAGVSAVIGAGVVGGLGLLGLAIAPPDALSLSRQAAHAGDDIPRDLPEADIRTIAGFRALFESAHGLIDARPAPGGGSTDALLWIDDAHDRGVVNEDELLILTYAPVLESILALTRAPGGDAAPMPTEALFSDDLAARWRARSDVDRAVVATDVTAVQIEPIGRAGGVATLRIRLTFRASVPDQTMGQPTEAVFVVRLPAVSKPD